MLFSLAVSNIFPLGGKTRDGGLKCQTLEILQSYISYFIEMSPLPAAGRLLNDAVSRAASVTASFRGNPETSGRPKNPQLNELMS